jgi:tocopherol cyclase
MKLYNPEVFQGNLNKSGYFEGWYFKHSVADSGLIWSFIPGISLTGKGSHAFIQVINGITGKTKYIEFPVKEFIASSSGLYVKIGKSVFTRNFIELDFQTEEIQIQGRIDYSEVSPFPSRFLSPGIMGWYSFVPFMECKHGVVSMNHCLEGKLNINAQTVDFNGGKGYIEKDWGKSFPSCWIWMQANNFLEKSASVMFSVARIPWLGKHFMGFISFFFLFGEVYLFTSYNGSKIERISKTDEILEIELSNRETIIKMRITGNVAGSLKAPKHGEMDRIIKESVNARTEVELFSRKGEVLYKGFSQASGLEIVGQVMEMLENPKS